MDVFNNEVVANFPDIHKIDFIKINKKYFNVILVNFFLFLLPLLSILFVLHQYIFNDEVLKYSALIYILFFVFFGLILVYNMLSFPTRKYLVREKDISYKSGLFYKKMTTVPFSRIQHVEIDEGPISRYYKLASLSVYTAGDSSDDLVIKGLSREKALQIKEFISSKINE